MDHLTTRLHRDLRAAHFPNLGGKWVESEGQTLKSDVLRCVINCPRNPLIFPGLPRSVSIGFLHMWEVQICAPHAESIHSLAQEVRWAGRVRLWKVVKTGINQQSYDFDIVSMERNLLCLFNSCVRQTCICYKLCGKGMLYNAT